MCLAGIDSLAFANFVVVIGRQASERFQHTARPANYNLVGLQRLSESEVQSQIALRNKTIAAPYFLLAFVIALL